MSSSRSLSLLLGSCVLGGTIDAAESLAAIASAPGLRMQVEAIEPAVVRLWFKPSGEFTREPSLATDRAPRTRTPLTVTRAAAATVFRTSALAVHVEPDTLAFSVLADPGGENLLPATTVTLTDNGPRWSMTRPLAPGERLLGLGQDNLNGGRLDRRGVIRELWAGQQINSGNVTAEYPVPLLLSVGADGRACGLFFDNVHRLRFDLGATRVDELRLDADGGEIDLYVIAGPKLAEVIERYTRLTGRPSLPPLWALGFWQSKCTYHDWRALDDAYEQLSTRGFPVDAMVIDFDWPEVANNFQWAKRWFVDGRTPADRIADYARRGVKIVVSQSGPMIREESPTYLPGWTMGVFATDGAGHPVEAGYYGGKLLDFTHPKINEWLWPQVRERTREGIAAWWLDLTEPEGEPPQTHYFGGRPANVHNQYSQLVTRSFEGALLAERPGQRPWILTRTGSAGTQAHHAAVWTGDVYSDYATLRAHVPEMLNSGLSGLVWWTSDSGGFMEGYYKNDQMGAHARLYERWMQFSVFSPITRAHKAGGLPEPYQFGPAVEQSSLHYLRLRYRLLPYLYSYAWEASRTGLPLTRPLALEFPEDAASAAAPGDQYLFGRELLVAPVLHEGLTNRTVYFPPGRWFDWDTGLEYAGGRTWVVAAPPNRIPVAVRAGAIIPMGPDMRNTSERPWDPLTLEVYPSAVSTFQLYRDDGASLDCPGDQCTVTDIRCEATSRSVMLRITESNKRFAPSTYLARFHLEATPMAVTSTSGRPLTHAWSAEERVLTVELAAEAAATTHGINVELDGIVLPSRPAPELTAQVIDARGEVTGSGRPVPHFYPAPALPNRIKAVNYDKGGEGTGFHTTRPLPAHPRYRPDDFSIREGNDAGGGDVLGDLGAGEWSRYTIDCGRGGWFDLSVRAASAAGGGRFRLVALDQVVATIDVPATGGDDVWHEILVPSVYLNPGELSLLLLVEKPGFRLNTLGFAVAAEPLCRYPASRARRSGPVEILRGGGESGNDAVRNLGRKDTSLTWGVVAPEDGTALLRFRFQSQSAKPLDFALTTGGAGPLLLSFPAASGQWETLEARVSLERGANSVCLAGRGEGWDSLVLDHLELLPR